jgi:hypothetical protein
MIIIIIVPVIPGIINDGAIIGHGGVAGSGVRALAAREQDQEQRYSH